MQTVLNFLSVGLFLCHRCLTAEIFVAEVGHVNRDLLKWYQNSYWNSCGGTEELGASDDISESQAISTISDTPVGTSSGSTGYPWMVALTLKTSKENGFVIWCGSTLITEIHILAAAHCFELSRNPEKYSALIRAHNIESPSEVIDLKSILIHPDYQPFEFYDDIAVATLARPLKVRPVCLPIIEQKGMDTSEIEVLGYGSLSPVKPSGKTLRSAKLTVTSDQKCNATYANERDGILSEGITRSHICAGSTTNDTCQNDSSSPLVTDASLGKRTVVGLLSFGDQCAQQDRPGVYSRVRTYLPWILKTIEPL